MAAGLKELSAAVRLSEAIQQSIRDNKLIKMI